MKKLANLTLHKQNNDEYVEYGFEFIGEGKPLGFLVKLNDNAECINTKAKETVNSLGDVHGVVVGGLSSSTYYLIREALLSGLDAYEALTERIRDNNDRFVFKLRGLRQIK